MLSLIQKYKIDFSSREHHLLENEYVTTNEEDIEDGEYRDVDGFQMCPYSDCDGDTVWDAFHWESIRDKKNEYPREPVEGVVYPMYVDDKQDDD